MGSAINTDSRVTLMAKTIDLVKTIMVLGLINHSHMSESAPDTRIIKYTNGVMHKAAAISDGIKIHSEVLIGKGFVKVKTWMVSYESYILQIKFEIYCVTKRSW